MKTTSDIDYERLFKFLQNLINRFYNNIIIQISRKCNRDSYIEIEYEIKHH